VLSRIVWLGGGAVAHCTAPVRDLDWLNVTMSHVDVVAATTLTRWMLMTHTAADSDRIAAGNRSTCRSSENVLFTKYLHITQPVKVKFSHTRY